MAFRSSHPIAGGAPAAQHTLFAISHQRWWISPTQIHRHFFKGVIELAGQTAAEGHSFLLQGTSGTREHQAVGHGRLLQRLQQPPPEGQKQAVLTRGAPPLAINHWPIGVVTPTAAALHALQQGRMGFQPLRSHSPAQAYTHQCGRTGGSGLHTARRLLREEGGKAAALLIKQQLAMGDPLPLSRVGEAIQPGATPAAQPTAQEAVVKRNLAGHGIHARWASCPPAPAKPQAGRQAANTNNNALRPLP
jgi:hypothetical protein